jgi:hypothetical protein
MPRQSRTLVLLLALAVVGAPAIVLRGLCVGRSCDRPAQAQPEIPFCSLPGQIRGLIAAGYRDGRSPDVMGVAEAGVTLGAGPASSAPPWPSLSPNEATPVPIVFWGTGVQPEARIPAGAGIRDISPTIASMLGFRMPHPEVRSGRPLPVVSATPSRLVLVVVWKGVGSDDLRAPDRWPTLRRLLGRGAGTLQGDVGFLPQDPTAVLTTLGTGGLPAEHGITGALIRSDGRVSRAWGPHAPPSVIATLADDLDEAMGQRPRIGLVGSRSTDRGIVGGNWYLRGDRDDIVVERGGPAAEASAAERLLEAGYGRDAVPDLLAVAMEGPVSLLDKALDRVVRAARSASGGSVTVVATATGSSRSSKSSFVMEEDDIRREVESTVDTGVIEGVAPGGLFLDQQILAQGGVATDDVLRALRMLRDETGQPLLADAFPGIAVTLSRYC